MIKRLGNHRYGAIIQNFGISYALSLLHFISELDLTYLY